MTRGLRHLRRLRHLIQSRMLGRVLAIQHGDFVPQSDSWRNTKERFPLKLKKERAPLSSFGCLKLTLQRARTNEKSVAMNGPSNRILIVENESAALASVRNLLRQEGYAVAAAQNAVQASDILKQQQLAVVLADQQTPVLTGVEFLAEVKRIQPDTSRVLMASSLTMSAAIQAINRVEVYRLVHKP